MPSSLKKFLFDDFFFNFGLLISAFITISKLSYSVLFAAIMGGLFVFFSVVFTLLFSKFRFFKRNMARTLSILLLIISAVVAYLMPFLNSVLIDDQMALDALKSQSRLFRIFGVESEVLGFTIISVILDSFIISVRIIAAKRCTYLYKTLFSQVLCENCSKLKLYSAAVSIIPLLVASAVFIFSAGLYRTIYAFLLVILFASASLVVLAKNPITIREQGRLDVYMAEKLRADSSPLVLERIKFRIVKRWVENYNLPFVEELIMFFSRFVFSLKIKGSENIKYSNLPSVFVANHGEIVGPVCGASYMPVVFRPYVHDHMCDQDKSSERMWRYTFSKFLGFLGEEKGRKVAAFAAKYVTKWINSYEPIHSFVSDGDPRKSMKSMHDGLDSLMDGDSILIFPEDTGKNEGNIYSVGRTGELFSGFAHIGKLYFDKLKRDLYFYPVFINKRKKTFTIGEPVIFNSNENITIEKKRVAVELQNRMNQFV